MVENHNSNISNGPMLNAYPDSMGGTLSDIVAFLQNEEVKGTFESFYILPSLFHTDLDRGFSVIDYSLNECLASEDDLVVIKNMGINLKLDFILNHASVLSMQFLDILDKGENSKYKDFFISWNEFWEGHGEMTEEGYIMPDKEEIQNMFFRKPGLPILMVRFPDGKMVPYWNTFYQEVRYEIPSEVTIMQTANVQYQTAQRIKEYLSNKLSEGIELSKLDIVSILPEYISERTEKQKRIINLLQKSRKYLGQMDLNIHSCAVWDFYKDTLLKLAKYGASIVRLDAFAYASKIPGKRNFLNEPETWDLLRKINDLAKPYQIELLPEIHATYAEKSYEEIAQRGYMTYDFFLPGLLIDACERKSGDYLCKWAMELSQKKIRTVNMLGCHDGIPMLDLRGFLPDERIEQLIDILVKRGGYVKDLHGQKNMYYQVSSTYFSALGESEKKLLFARAIQIFMPGKPQVWYLDLFAGKNNKEIIKLMGAGGHKEINRTNLTTEQIEEGLKRDVVKEQLKLLRFRAWFAAFSFESQLTCESKGVSLQMSWEKDGYKATLIADFEKFSYLIKAYEAGAEICSIAGRESDEK